MIQNMSTDPWGRGTGQDPKLRRREKKVIFGHSAYNPDRLPGEPFDREPPKSWRRVILAPFHWFVRPKWTIRDWVFLAATCVVLLQTVRYFLG